MKSTPLLLILVLTSLLAAGSIALGQSTGKTPLQKDDILRMLKAENARVPQGEIAVEVDERGLAFPVTDQVLEEFQRAGAHSFLLDAIKRAGGKSERPHIITPGEVPASTEGAPARTEEEERKERDEAISRMPPIEQARYHALDYVNELPNFVVTEFVTRYIKTPEKTDWRLDDRLEVELTYRVKEGEQLKLIKINGAAAKTTYEHLGGSTSVGEFGVLLGALFAPQTQADFKEVRKESLNGKQTTVFDFKVRTAHSNSQITDKSTGQSVVSGYVGTVWIDNQTKRVLRVEVQNNDIPSGFPITLAENAIEYDYVDVAGERYLMPVRAEVLLGRDRDRQYTRNVIEFRNYHKFETDVQILSPTSAPEKP